MDSRSQNRRSRIPRRTAIVTALFASLLSSGCMPTGMLQACSGGKCPTSPALESLRALAPFGQGDLSKGLTTPVLQPNQDATTLLTDLTEGDQNDAKVIDLVDADEKKVGSCTLDPESGLIAEDVSAVVLPPVVEKDDD